MRGLPAIDQTAAAISPVHSLQRRRILLAPLGTWGDVIPFVQIGRELRRRGHEVTLVACDLFEPLARRAELDFLPLFGREEYERVVANPRLWHPRWAGITFLREAVLPFMRRQFEVADDVIRSGECDVLVAPAQSLGARIAEEVHGTSLVTVHLAPYMFRSAIASRRVSGVSLPDWFPPELRRAFFRLADSCGDVSYGRDVNAFRGELGLPRAKRVFWDWWNSPERIVALFPKWFAQPQSDWPSQTILAGFLPAELAETPSLDEDVEDFLRKGAAPLLFTVGTAMAHGKQFFAESVGAAERLGMRAILLTQFREQLPERLPPDVLALDFVSLPELLLRVAAIVHHGGIGTTTQALAAGVPQLVVPMSFDQPDNAQRVENLGVGRVLGSRAYGASCVSAELQSLLSDTAVAARCGEVAARCREADGLRGTCVEIEAVGSVHDPNSDRYDQVVMHKPR